MLHLSPFALILIVVVVILAILGLYALFQPRPVVYVQSAPVPQPRPGPPPPNGYRPAGAPPPPPVPYGMPYGCVPVWYGSSYYFVAPGGIYYDPLGMLIVDMAIIAGVSALAFGVMAGAAMGSVIVNDAFYANNGSYLNTTGYDVYNGGDSGWSGGGSDNSSGTGTGWSSSIDSQPSYPDQGYQDSQPSANSQPYGGQGPSTSYDVDEGSRGGSGNSYQPQESYQPSSYEAPSSYDVSDSGSSDC